MNGTIDLFPDNVYREGYLPGSLIKIGRVLAKQNCGNIEKCGTVKYMDKEEILQSLTDAEKARIILGKLTDKELSAETLELIQGWMASGVNVHEKDRFLAELFDSYFFYDTQPEEWVHQHYEKFRECVANNPRVSGRVQVRKLPRKFIWRKIAAAAVVVLLVGAGGFLLWDNYFPEPVATELTTVVVPADYGEAQNITLPDGSTVRIMPGTELKYSPDFQAGRNVRLTGEAYFRVVRSEELPFSVRSDNLKVTVLGTEFNMRDYPQESGSEVALTSGSVEVVTGNDKVMLKPMTRFKVDSATGHSEISPFDPVLADRWSKGSVEINGLPLEDALLLVGGFYGKEVRIEAELPRDSEVTTILYDNKTVETSLKVILLACGSDYKYRVEEDVIYISNK